MKRILSVLLCAVIIFTLVPLISINSIADSKFTSGDYEYTILQDGTAAITRYTGSATELIIPSILDGYCVTKIDCYAFDSCILLESVIIPSGIKEIEYKAFEMCSSLKSVKIPDSVNYIDKWTFLWCYSLVNIDVSESNQRFSSVEGVLFNKEKTELILYPASKEGVEYCIPNTVTSIDNNAFEGCSLLTNIIIHDGVYDIGYQAFYNCSALTTISVSDSNKNYSSIDGVLFNKEQSALIVYPIGRECAGYDVPNSVINICNCAFSGCKLKSIIIPNNVTGIGEGAFENCASLTKVIIRNSLTNIGVFAFGYLVVGIDIIPNNNGLTIYGYSGSSAEDYAKNNQLEFILIKTFPDISDDAWYNEAAYYNASRGFITGYKNGNFGPADALQRQDFVVILARIAGADLSKYKTCKLTDVDMNAYYGPAVAWAVDEGIISGYNNGKFGVGDKITREQVATILYRYSGSPSVNTSVLNKFADKGNISSFAVNAMAWANTNGIINGKADGKLAPTATASRAEIATIIMRMDQQGMFA